MAFAVGIAGRFGCGKTEHETRFHPRRVRDAGESALGVSQMMGTGRNSQLLTLQIGTIALRDFAIDGARRP
jgi:hypothetical protein